MHRIFSAIFKQYMCILLQYINRTRISSFVHTGITIATQVSQFKKKVTHDDTFDITFFSKVVLFSKIRHMVSISANFCIFIREIRQNISNEDLDIYHFSKKT